MDLTTGDRREIEVVFERGTGQALAPVTIVGRGTSFDRTGYAARLNGATSEDVNAVVRPHEIRGIEVYVDRQPRRPCTGGRRFHAAWS